MPEVRLPRCFDRWLLYKEGERKDCDLLFYRIRQVEKVEFLALFAALGKIGLNLKSGFGWCYKCEYNGKVVDCFDPDDGSEIHFSTPDWEVGV